MSEQGKMEDILQLYKSEIEENQKAIDTCIEDFKKAVINKKKNILIEISQSITEVRDLANQYFQQNNQSQSSFVDVDIPDFSKVTTYNEKVALLQSFIDELKLKNKSKINFEKGVLESKGKDLDLFKINKNKQFEMKVLSKIKTLLNGKSCFDLKWKTVQNQPQWSNIDTNDSSVLNVNGRGCYNYYLTDHEFDPTLGESCEFEFESTVVNNDNYFYFGVVNETAVPSSNCMCCTIAQGLYIQHSGTLVIHGQTETNPNLEFKSKKGEITTLRVKLIFPEKEVFFQVDDKGEQGPFKLVGEKFRITFGSCNTADGKIKIVSGYLI